MNASGRLYSVMSTPNTETVARMIAVLFPDVGSILDLTYGSGGFWKDSPYASHVTGIDLLPDRAKDVVADFTQLPFKDGAFSLCVFDPPYLADVSKKNPGINGRRFGSFGSQQDVQDAVWRGCQEAWRVASLGLIAKVQIHTHGTKLVDMEGWVRDALMEPIYGRVEQVRPSKLLDPRWSDQLSVWSNSASFLCFRKGDQRHIRRGCGLQGNAS